MQSQILTAGTLGLELLLGLGKEFQIVRPVLPACPVEFVFPFHACPPHGVGRICISVIDFVSEHIVLILVGSPVIEAEFGAESGVITAEVVGAVQIGGITVLRVGVVLVHLQKHVQIIILIVDGRVTQLFVIVPADNIAAGAGLVVVSNAVISDFCREEIESILFIPQLLKHIIGHPRVSLEEIGTILLQVGISIQSHTVIKNPGEIFAGCDNVRQIAAGQSGSVLLICQKNILNIHANLIRQILPHAEIFIITGPGTRGVFTDRQDNPVLLRGRFLRGRGGVRGSRSFCESRIGQEQKNHQYR